jgi:hypothetical protein
MKRIFPAALLLILALSACGQAKNTAPSKPSGASVTVTDADPSEETDNPSSDYTPVDQCLPACAALGEGEALINRKMCEGSCWAAEAKEKKDISICREKIDQDNGIPRIACFMNIAEETGDASACNGISDDEKDAMRQGCYAAVAKKFQKPEMCEGIKGSFLYDTCLSDAKSGE